MIRSQQHPTDLAGTVAVITGGANGIGLAIAHRLGGEGAHVVVADRDRAALDRAASDLATDGIEATTVETDVTSADDQQWLTTVARDLGPIGVVALNAGISAGGSPTRVPLDQWRDLFEVNVFGVVAGLNHFAPILREQGRGHLVITGSSAGFRTADRGVDAPYAASKHALLGVARCYRSFLDGTGVTVQLLAPRMTDTAFPRSSVAWGRDGSFVVGDHDIGPADTPAQVADELMRHLGSEHLVIGLGPDLADDVRRFAETDITTPVPKETT